MDFKLKVCFVFLLVNIFISQLLAQECFTARGETGSCKEIRQCPRMLEVLKQKPLLQENVRYLQQSRCLNYYQQGSTVIICCPFNTPTSTSTYRPTNNFRDNVDLSRNFNLRNHPLLPSNCGEDTAERIVGGERTDLDEFPWTVLLEYQRTKGRSTDCGGALINNLYVLTAAHCVKHLSSAVTLLSVRLGEYDTSQQRDCIRHSGFQACADPIVSIPIAEVIVHENYKPKLTQKFNDIALLRLARKVIYTDYIKPICLPQNSNVGQLFDVVGWGLTEYGANSDIKLKVKVPLAPLDECQRNFSNSGYSVEIGEGQICAGGERGKDSCKGDSGGPLMMRVRENNNGRWVSVGIVSFGPSECGKQNVPGVYTKVYDYVPWILSKLRP